MITIQHQEEALSVAYFISVVTQAGCNYSFRGSPGFDYKIDASIHQVTKIGNQYEEIGIPIDVQLKATKNWRENATHIIYDMEVDAYNSFIRRKSRIASPLILALLCLPTDITTWIDHSDSQLILRKCSYWHSIAGNISTNSRTKTIHIPKTQVFSPSSVLQLTQMAESGSLV